ncbi:class I adenylate-forming enzyme family protein [Nocardia rhamnosiphila]|uniref:Class I adenylate-forming enzyme family protein n=1 Tax=Nocardia rhamnosiphila TaxID=426716 RepID=A0ABV2X2B0_9NOCA
MTNNSSRPSLADLWGTTTAESVYAGHPGFVLAPRPSSLGEMLAGVTRWAGRTYLVQGSRRIRFSQFLTAIPEAGRTLAAKGVAPGDHVVILGRNSPQWVLALWGCWQVGAVPVLANRWWGESEIRHAMQISRPVLTISDRPAGIAEGVPDLPMDNLAPAFDVAERPDLDAIAAALPTPDEDTPALVIFTSGSSGTPKGVVLSHRSIIANQHNLLSRSGRLPTDDPNDDQAQQVALVCAPMFHIGGISNLLTNLIIGGKIVLTEGRFDPAQILRLIEAEKVQTFGGVPTMAIRVIEHSDFDKHDLSSLRSWPLGGAPVSSSLLERMARRLPQLKQRGLGNTWGMSESGGFITVAGHKDLDKRPGTVGRAYPVAELRIDSPDATGVGEILVRSPTNMLGYLGLPEDSTVDSEGWLHTGDLGHLDEDGYLYLDGRSKDIIIRGGENIASAHVELAIAQHPDVLEVAVFGIPHAELGEEVAAIVRHKGEGRLDPTLLREFLGGTLAHYSLPTCWRFRTDRLPTLAGEKIDKQRLKAELLTEMKGVSDRSSGTLEP